MQDLKALLPQPVEVQIGRGTLSLMPLVFEDLATVMPLALPLREAFAKAGLSELPKLAISHSAALAELTACMARIPVEIVQQLSIGQLVKLFETCVEVNADFFTEALPRYTRFLVSVSPKATSSAGNGSSPSPAASAASTSTTAAGYASLPTSSPTATAGPTSAATPSDSSPSSDANSSGSATTG